MTSLHQQMICSKKMSDEWRHNIVLMNRANDMHEWRISMLVPA